MKKTRVLISGAGVGGLALARILERKGIAYLLVEKRDEKSAFSSPGALMMQSSGLSVIKEFDDSTATIDLLNKLGHRLKTTVIKDNRNVILSKTNIQSLLKLENGFGLGIKRADFLDALASVKLKSNCIFSDSISEVSPVDQVATLQSGTQIQYGVLVCAEGMNSLLTQMLFKQDFVSVPIAGWLAIIENTPRTKGTAAYCFEYYCGAAASAGVFNVSEDKRYVFYFANLGNKLDGSEMDRDPNHIDLEKVFKDFPKCITGPINEGTLERPIRLKRRLRPHWGHGNTVVIGDAAHGIEPFIGIGANLAMEDALVLARLIEAGNASDLSAQLSRARTSRVSKISLINRLTQNLSHGSKYTSQFLRFSYRMSPKYLQFQIFKDIWNVDLGV